MIKLLGHGSKPITTASEKFYPVEFEAMPYMHTAVIDKIVIGITDPRFGQLRVAIAEMSTPANAAGLIEHIRDRLTEYRTTRDLVLLNTVACAPKGKMDYDAANLMSDVAITREKSA